MDKRLTEAQTKAQILNYFRRNLLGAAGNCGPSHLRSLPMKIMSVEENLYLSGLVKDAYEVTKELKRLADVVEDYFLLFGTDRTKAEIKARRAIQAKIDAGKAEELTDAEWKRLHPNFTRQRNAAKRKEGAVKSPSKTPGWTKESPKF